VVDLECGRGPALRGPGAGFRVKNAISLTGFDVERT
jgi:hypothetical protein